MKYLANRFHVARGLFSNRSQMTSKGGKNKRVAHEATAEIAAQNQSSFGNVNRNYFQSPPKLRHPNKKITERQSIQYQKHELFSVAAKASFQIPTKTFQKELLLQNLTGSFIVQKKNRLLFSLEQSKFLLSLAKFIFLATE